MAKTESYYQMHKYWGKKPAENLYELLDKYTSKGDIVLDPFSGYGVFTSEAYLNGRNAIGNDLNPASVFIQKQLLNMDVDISIFSLEIEDIIEGYKELFGHLYSDKCPKCNSKAMVIATLRSKHDEPLMNRIKCSCSNTMIEYELSDESALAILDMEKEIVLIPHPVGSLIKNGRISVKEGMTTDDLFTRRSLQCHSYLYSSINAIKNSDIRDLAKFVFTSNLANCSKLVPPIKSRGPMNPGAWMTGFYIGETYIENNVFHYFNNRLLKTIKGKKAIVDRFSNNIGKKGKGRINEFSNFDSQSTAYLITNEDSKKLSLPSNSIDYVFTDPPYGDSVPYFEQSSIWNIWLEFCVDFENELVISDSKQRKKNLERFSDELAVCISEVYRVLKVDSYFSITFHSLSGGEWYAMTRACIECGFVFEDYKWLTQKTFTPRQLNRKSTVKGDVLITFKKIAIKPNLNKFTQKDIKELILVEAEKLIVISPRNTNDLYIAILRVVFERNIIFEEVNFIKILNERFTIDVEGQWSLA